MRNANLGWKAAAVISALCISGAFASAQLWALALIPLAPVVLWLFSQHPGHGFRPAFHLCASTALAALGMHLQLPMPLLLLGTAAALAAWDLAHSAERLRLAVSDEHRAPLGRAHLPSLFLAIASGLGLAILASVVRLQLSFGVVSLLALVMVLAISGIPRAIRPGGGPSSTP